jgi:transposase InsO family protein
MIDCFDGMVVSWSIGTSPDAELVNGMLDAAIETVAKTLTNRSSIPIEVVITDGQLANTC